MKIVKIYLVIIYTFLISTLFAARTSAVLPPDIIPQVASHVAYFFALLLGILSTVWISIINFIRIFYSHIKIPKWLILVGLIIVVIVSYIIAVLLNNATN